MDEINNLGYKALIICSNLVVQLDLLNQGAKIVGDSWNLTNVANAKRLRYYYRIKKNCLFRQLVILTLKNFVFNFSLLSVIRAREWKTLLSKSFFPVLSLSCVIPSLMLLCVSCYPITFQIQFLSVCV